MKKYQVSFINDVCETRCIEVEASCLSDAIMKARNELIDCSEIDKWKLNFCVAARFDMKAERAGIILDITRSRASIESVAKRVFEVVDWPLKELRYSHDHLMDASKSLGRAVVMLPDDPEEWTRGPEPMLDKP